MADGMGIEVHTAAFEGALQKLKWAVRKGLIDPEKGTLTVQARLLSEQCQKFTPPQGGKEQGFAAVARDLTRIYFPQSERTYSNKSMKSIVRQDNRESWNAAARNFSASHGLRNTIAVGFTEDMHRRYQDKRGRVKGGKYGNVGFVTLGPEATAARNYIKKIQGRIGWAKAGWNMGILVFGGQVKGAWIARHSVSRGRVIDERNSPDPWVSVTNDTGWAKYNDSEGMRITRNAVNSRIRHIHQYVEKQMELAAEEATRSPIAA